MRTNPISIIQPLLSGAHFLSCVYEVAKPQCSGMWCWTWGGETRFYREETEVE